MTLIDGIEGYLARTGTAPAQFGRAVMRDPRFVFDLRNGRQPRTAAIERVTSVLEGLNP